MLQTLSLIQETYFDIFDHIINRYTICEIYIIRVTHLLTMTTFSWKFISFQPFPSTNAIWDKIFKNGV